MSTVTLSPSQNETYDEMPYESYPYDMTSPQHLRTMATFFGMKPPAIETARVLELGCASGGNLIPHAVNYPKAHFVGVDLSKVQIDEANKDKTALNLNNIEFYACSITEIDQSFGKFDYIICHGVFSWVPEFVREAILKISKENLTENGVAYISYNTLPGWNMVRTIRDMMLYHSNIFTDVKDKVAQSRLLLEFVKDSLEGSNTPYAQMLKSETELLFKQADNYLRHEHLEDNNVQFYFSDFMDMAKKNDLQYLADCNIASMYLGNMPAKVVEKLQTIKDIVRVEQYMDFINNRRFRSTLLCHSNVKLKRNVNNDDIVNYNITCNIFPEKALADIDINSLETEKFFYNNNKDNSMSTSSPYMKAILYTFFENLNNPLSFDKIIASSNKKLGGGKVNELKAEFLANIMHLFLQGYVSITLQDTRKEVKCDKPKTSKLVAYQATHSPSMWVTNQRHQAIGVNLFEKCILKYMDGKNEKSDIIDSVMQHVTSGEITLSRDGKKIEDVNEIRKEFESYLEPTIARFITNALLV
jgi:methyltransferase-like protein/trans-aconitate methyltransferase